jgi:hypothetical protein
MSDDTKQEGKLLNLKEFVKDLKDDLDPLLDAGEQIIKQKTKEALAETKAQALQEVLAAGVPAEVIAQGKEAIEALIAGDDEATKASLYTLASILMQSKQISALKEVLVTEAQQALQNYITQAVQSAVAAMATYSGREDLQAVLVVLDRGPNAGDGIASVVSVGRQTGSADVAPTEILKRAINRLESQNSNDSARAANA